MRTDQEYRHILRLWEQGTNKKRIACITQIPRATVRECIARYGSISGLDVVRETVPRTQTILKQLQNHPLQDQNMAKAYAYLLGLYLGDGYINQEPRTYRRRISLDTAYPQIIQSCVDAIAALLPSNKVGIAQNEGNCISVSCYNNHWPDFFPQHGTGLKHKRQVRLDPWQQRIVVDHSEALLRGMIHSDGSRSSNMVNGTDYPRYSFTNYSEDIKEIFCEACDRLGVHWTVTSSGRSIQIARREDVATLDQFIGPKA